MKTSQSALKMYAAPFVNFKPTKERKATTSRLQYDSLLIDNARYVLSDAGDTITQAKEQYSPPPGT